MSQQYQKRILILDDEPDTIALLKLRLENRGYQVLTGLDGLEGLVKLRKKAPDLIIMDIVMPKMNGLELFKTIKRDDAFRNTPVMILTAKPDYRDEFLKMGCDYFATKPFDANHLVSAASELMKEKVLVVGEYKDFQEHIHAEFSDGAYVLKFVDQVSEMFSALQEDHFHLVVLRLAQADAEPDLFMEKIRCISRNPSVRILAYCDAYTKGVETGDEVAISKLALKWSKAGNVLFYDSRIHGPAIIEFISDDE